MAIHKILISSSKNDSDLNDYSMVSRMPLSSKHSKRSEKPNYHKASILDLNLEL